MNRILGLFQHQDKLVYETKHFNVIRKKGFYQIEYKDGSHYEYCPISVGSWRMAERWAIDAVLDAEERWPNLNPFKSEWIGWTHPCGRKDLRH